LFPKKDTVLAYDRDADGDVAPKRILKGAGKFDAFAVAVDPLNNLLIVSSTLQEGQGGGGGRGQLLIFNRTDSGNTKPRAVIKGPKSGLARAPLMTTHPPRSLILASVRGPVGSTGTNYVGVWSVFDNGDVPPRWTIGGPGGMLENVRGVIVDPQHKSVIISDKSLNAVLTYEFPGIF